MTDEVVVVLSVVSGCVGVLLGLVLGRVAWRAGPSRLNEARLHGVVAERNRVRLGVERLKSAHDHLPTYFCVPSACPYGMRTRILELIDGEKYV